MTNPPWPDRGPDDQDRGPGGDADVDAAFAAIIAGWDLEADPSRRPTPNLPPGSANKPNVLGAPPADRSDAPVEPRAADGEAAAEATPRSAAPPAPPAPSFAVAPAGWRVHVPPDDDDLPDEAFEQPDPPLPRGARFWAAVTGLLFGPVLFVVWAMTAPHSTSLPYLLAGLATLAGFVALITALPERHDEDDDGARV